MSWFTCARLRIFGSDCSGLGRSSCWRIAPPSRPRSREESQEHADGRQPAGDGSRRLAPTRLVLEIIAEVVGVGREQRLAGSAEMIVHVFEIAAVGVQRVVRQAALGREM